MVDGKCGHVLDAPQNAEKYATRYLTDRAARSEAGDRARAVVLSQQGAAARSADIIMKALQIN
jgi:hypothetical protein